MLLGILEHEKMKKQDWIWMPHAAHFIGGHRCQFKLSTCGEIDFAPYNDADSATIGHMKMCEKWSKKK